MILGVCLMFCEGIGSRHMSLCKMVLYRWVVDKCLCASVNGF